MRADNCIVIFMNGDIFSQQSNPQISDTCRAHQGGCPSWDACRNVCLQVKDGLFLPVAQHVTAYCQSSRHPSCPHFRLQTTTHDGGPRLHASRPERRRSDRIATHRLFRFSETSTSSKSVATEQDDAWAIDLSDTGARFASARHFLSGTAIHFLLAADDTTACTEGIGQVIWSKPLGNTSLFQTGIAFTEQRTLPCLNHP